MFHCKCPFYKTKAIKFERCVTFEMAISNNFISFFSMLRVFQAEHKIYDAQIDFTFVSTKQEKRKELSENEFKNRSEEIQANE